MLYTNDDFASLLSFVSQWLSDGYDYRLKSSSGQKAGEMFPTQATEVLCKACSFPWSEVTAVRGLLDAGTNVNQCDEHDESPLMHASREGHIDVINVLVSHGADVNYVNQENKTSLLLACEEEQWDAALVLYQHIIKAEADTTAKKHRINDEAFEIALQHHCVRYLQYVAGNDRGAYDKLVSKFSLSDACEHGYDLVVKHHALHHNLNQNCIINAVKIACSNNQSVVIHALMPYLTNNSVSELITDAYQQGQYSFAFELFESCTDHSTLPCPNISITDACKARQLDLVELLIKHGKDVNKAADELGCLLKYVPDDADPLLHVLKASDNQTEDDMYGSVKVGATLSAVNDHNCHPPLVYACMQGNTSVVKLLLQHGADVNIRSDETPLTAACKHGHLEVVDVLLHNTLSPSICQTNMYGMTPLQVAVKYHQRVIARKLTDIYEADPNAYKAPDTEFTEVTLMPQRGLLNSISFVKHQSISQCITSIVPEKLTIWKIFLDPVKTEDAGTPPIVAAFQSKQYDLVKFFIGRSANYQPLFKHAALEDICQLEKVSLIQQFIIHSQPHTTQINYRKVLDVVAKLGNTDLMTYFLNNHQIHSETLGQALIQACQQGSQDMVRLLIQHDEYLVKSIEHNSSKHCQHPLCIAIRKSDVTMADALCQSGAELFSVSSSETSLLHTLSKDTFMEVCSQWREFSDILSQLIPECIHKNTLTSALIAACKDGNTRAARVLVSKGADVNGCDEKGCSPLSCAQHSSKLVTLLLTAGADPNTVVCHPYQNDHLSPLCWACRYQNFEIASELIDAGADSNPGSCSPLYEACRWNCIDIVELLLQNRADPNWANSARYILNIAHDNEYYEVARLLLEYGAEPSVLSGIGLIAACELGYTEVAQHIIHESLVIPDVLEQCIEGAYKNGFLLAALEAIMNIREKDIKDQCIHWVLTLMSGEMRTLADTVIVSGDVSLWRCLEKRNIGRMREVIKAGHDVNIPNITGRSLLQECIQQRITHVIPDLCASQIHIDHRDSAGRTALFYSLTCPHMHPVCGESISVFEYLVTEGADVNVRDYFGRSVLHEWQPASDGLKYEPSLKTLLENIDIDSRDHKGQTALHIAVLNENISAVKQLLKYGATMEAHDINDITPLFLARNNPVILHALQEDYPHYEYEVQDSPSSKKDHTQRVHKISNASKKHRLVPALKEVFHERAKYTQVDHFISEYQARVYYIMKTPIRDEKVLFEETVLQMLRDINDMVIQEEPVLSFTPRLSGSCAEGTKVISLNEADILCVFDDDSWKQITLSQVSSNAKNKNSSDVLTQDNTSFVQIASLSTNHQTLLKDGFISKRTLLQRLYSLVRKAIPAVLKNIRSLYMIDVKNAVANDHSLACLSMVWHGKELPWQGFTVDIVPAIPVTQDQLPDFTREVMNHPHIMQDLFVVPKTGTFDQSQNDAAFRVSFSSTERDMFLAMPAALKQGYMLTKVLIHDCITVDDIPCGLCSYNLKTATFECFKSETPNWKDLVKEAHKTGTASAESPEIQEAHKTGTASAESQEPQEARKTRTASAESQEIQEAHKTRTASAESKEMQEAHKTRTASAEHQETQEAHETRTASAEGKEMQKAHKTRTTSAESQEMQEAHKTGTTSAENQEIQEAHKIGTASAESQEIQEAHKTGTASAESQEPQEAHKTRTASAESQEIQEAHKTRTASAESKEMQEAHKTRTASAEHQETQEAHETRTASAEGKEMQKAHKTRTTSAESQEMQEVHKTGTASAESQEIQEAHETRTASAESQETQEAHKTGTTSAENQEIQEAHKIGTASVESQEIQEAHKTGTTSAESQEMQETRTTRTVSAESQEPQEAYKTRTASAESQEIQEAHTTTTASAESVEIQEAHRIGTASAENQEIQEGHKTRTASAESQEIQEAHTTTTASAESVEIQEAHRIGTASAENQEIQEAHKTGTASAESQEIQETHKTGTASAESQGMQEAHKTRTASAESKEILDVLRYAQNILQEIERSFVQKHQDSFFLRGCDLMLHSIDNNDYRQMLYVKYCAAVLSDTDGAAWQQLAECVAEQLFDSIGMPDSSNKSDFLHEIEILLDMGLKSQSKDVFEKMLNLYDGEGAVMMLERGAFVTGVIGETDLQDDPTIARFLEDNMRGNLIMHLCVIRNNRI